MSRPFFRPLAVLAICASTSLAEDVPPATASPTPQPGLLSRTWSSTKKLNPFKPKNQAVAEGKKVAAVFKGLTVKMTVDPAVPNLGENKQITVTLRLQNTGKKLVQLDFPTTQRIEVLVKNSTNKIVEQWSEDQAFQNEPSLVTINPGERLEYNAIVSTRDFAAGQEYTVEGFFPTYNMLRSAVKLVPTR